MGRLLASTFAYLAYLLANAIASQRQQHRVQHGPCSYTFILPEVEHCQPLKDFQVTNTLQSDSPPEVKPGESQFKQSRAQDDRPSWQQKKLDTLESAMENNTQWLQKVRCPQMLTNLTISFSLAVVILYSFPHLPLQPGDLQTKCCKTNSEIPTEHSISLHLLTSFQYQKSSMFRWDFLDAS